MIKKIDTLVVSHPYITGIILFVFGGCVVFLSIFLRNQSNLKAIMLIRDYEDKHYQLIRPPILAYENGAIADRQVPELKAELESYIESEKKAGNIADAAVYFRDMDNGPWFGINANEKFIPASLLKVPLMIGLLRAAEEHPDILKLKLTLTSKSTEVSAQIKNGESLKVGGAYTVDELIHRMIIDSDNDAANLLNQYMSENELYDVYRDLGLNVPSPDAMYTISVKEYASFFRILYNASYLSRDSSEKALTIITQTTFDKGIDAGVPTSIRVADKFGEREFESGRLRQLHDCGIVYVPQKPYLLCIMTEGADSDVLAKSIAHISQITYHAVVRK